MSAKVFKSKGGTLGGGTAVVVTVAGSSSANGKGTSPTVFIGQGGTVGGGKGETESS